jgi:tetratricopeptide (TPR) repeat protein
MDDSTPPEVAREFWNGASGNFVAQNQTALAAEFLLSLGKAYRGLGLPSEAIVHLNKSRDLFENLFQKKGVADAPFQLARMYEADGQSENAIEAYRLGVSLFAELGNVGAVIDLLTSLADLFQETLDPEQLGGRLEEIGNQYLDFRHRFLAANTYTKAGHAYLAVGNLTQAVEAFERGVRTHGLTQNFGPTAVAFASLSDGLIRNNDIATLGQTYDRLTQHFETLGDNDLLTEVLFRGGMDWEIMGGAGTRSDAFRATVINFSLDPYTNGIPTLVRYAIAQEALGATREAAVASQEINEQLINVLDDGKVQEAMEYVYSLPPGFPANRELWFTLGKGWMDSSRPEFATKALTVSGEAFENARDLTRASEVFALLADTYEALEGPGSKNAADAGEKSRELVL